MVRTVNIKKGSVFKKPGKKVTGIEFLNNRIAAVSTNDSRIRFFDIKVPLTFINNYGRVGSRSSN